MAREGDTLIVGGGFIDVDPSRPCSLGQSSAFAVNVIEPGPNPAPAPARLTMFPRPRASVKHVPGLILAHRMILDTPRRLVTVCDNVSGPV